MELQFASGHGAAGHCAFGAGLPYENVGPPYSGPSKDNVFIADAYRDRTEYQSG